MKNKIYCFIIFCLGNILGRGFRVWYNRKGGRWFWGVFVLARDFYTGTEVARRDVSDLLKFKVESGVTVLVSGKFPEKYDG